MELKINRAESVAESYFSLMEKNYGKSNASQYYCNDTRKGLEKVLQGELKQSVFFHAYKRNELIGHIALIPYKQGEAYFGFFECSQTECFRNVWLQLVSEAKKLGINKLFGPVNGTIWHPYRFISKSTDEPHFPSEPLSKPEYNALFVSLKPNQTIEYHSAYRTDYTTVMQVTQGSFRSALEEGIVIEIEPPGLDNIRELYNIAVDVFSANPGYSFLSLDDFIALYSNEKLSSNKGVIYTARAKGTIVGFCFNFVFENTMVMKTIVVMPQWQHKGIGNALVHRIHTHAIEKGITKVIYALVRKDNMVKHFPTDKVTFFREYSAHLFKI